MMAPTLRFLWYEYRVNRSLWLVIAGMSLTIQLVPLAWSLFPGSEINQDATTQLNLVMTVALVLTVFYAIGVGCTLFSRDNDQQTRDFLSTLPIPTLPIWCGKFLAACVTTIVLLLAIFSMSIGILGLRSEFMRLDIADPVLTTFSFSLIVTIFIGGHGFLDFQATVGKCDCDERNLLRLHAVYLEQFAFRIGFVDFGLPESFFPYGDLVCFNKTLGFKHRETPIQYQPCD